MSRLTEQDKSIEQTILDAVNKDEENIINFHRKHLEFLRNEYKKNKGRKKTTSSDEDFCIGIGDENETSEGSLLDFIWDSIQKIEKMKTKPSSLCEKALLCKNKAEELNILHKWNKPIEKAEFLTGYGGLNGDDFNELFKKGTITLELANNYEDYLEYHNDSDPILKDIKVFMYQNGISLLKIETKNYWIHHIALYYAKNKKNLPKYITFYPSNGKSSILDFSYYIISNEDLEDKINEYKKLFDEKEKSDKLLYKILEIKAKLSLHQYIMILANYFIEHPKSIKKDYVFHPLKKDENFKNDEIEYESINYDTIRNFKNHIKNCISEKNIKLINSISEWSKKNDKFKENMSEYVWTKIIKNYYKSNSLTIPKDIILYPISKSKKDFSLNHYIITYDDLTNKNSLFGLISYNDESDDEIF